MTGELGQTFVRAHYALMATRQRRACNWRQTLVRYQREMPGDGLVMSLCDCSERDVPIAYPPGFRARDTRHPMPDENAPALPRLWRVRVRNWNNSAFTRRGGEYSRYSQVTCLRCGRIWRTMATYVMQLADIADDEREISCGIDGHAAAMRARGREPHEAHGGEG